MGRGRCVNTAWEDTTAPLSEARGLAVHQDAVPHIPIFGNGDCYSGTGERRTDYSGVDGVMVAHGALIKPWIFTENVESGTSARASRWRESGRMPSMGYHTLAPTPPGSTPPGATSANRFPSSTATSRSALGILERLPVKLNERDELETLLASGDSRDWVRISEMFLGAPPETWGFTPKHQSSTYENQGRRSSVGRMG
ncbi:hypothetical protein C8F01DRAFT_159895 [Mycena amicta]|nr:hypothetical protein C8F01DRAFT_159895 [Mycena amicta]